LKNTSRSSPSSRPSSGEAWVASAAAAAVAGVDILTGMQEGEKLCAARGVGRAGKRAVAGVVVIKY